MKNKIELTFGEKTYTAKFGIGFIGEYLQKEAVKIEDLFKNFQDNPFYVAPKLIQHSINKGTEDANLTLSEVEDLIDDDGGLQSKNLELFINEFAKSLTTNSEDLGKPKAPKKAKA